MSLRQSGFEKVTELVNAIISRIPTGSSTNTDIKMNGTQSAGSSSNFAKADHVHPIDTSRAASSHSHGNLTNDGKLGSSANKPVITTTSGKVTTGSFGTAANTFCQGNDSRLSNARTPTAHTHTKSEITDFRHTHNYDTNSILTIPIGSGEAQYLQLNLDTGMGIYAKWNGSFSIPTTGTWNQEVNFNTVLETYDFPYSIEVLGTSWTSNILNGTNGLLFGRAKLNYFSVYSSVSTGTVYHVPFTVPFFFKLENDTD